MHPSSPLVSMNLLAVALGGALVAFGLGSCGAAEDRGTDEADATASCKGALRFSGWRDLGALPASTARHLTVMKDRVLVATDKGIFWRPLDGSSDWKASGLDGDDVGIVFAPDPEKGLVLAALHQDEGAEPLIKPPLWRSADGGASWKAVGDFRDPVLSTPDRPVYEVITDIVSVPSSTGKGALLLNANATTVLRSTDNGFTWKIIVGEPGAFGYGCLLTVPQATPNLLVQGCEVPLDSAWLGSYDLKASNVGNSFQLIVSEDSLGNKRPNSVASFPWTKETVYAGVEGGLVRLSPKAPEKMHWIFKHDGEQTGQKFPYTYVQHVWADPCDAKHVVFGGWDKADAAHSMQLYETFDEGGDLKLVAPPDFLVGDSFFVGHGIPIGQGSKNLLFTVDVLRGSQRTAHVLVRQHAPAAVDACCQTASKPGCATDAVRDCVCADDGYCCESAWDQLCVQEVTAFGCGSCAN